MTWYKTFHKINIPPMVHFKTAGFTCSAWLPAGVSFLTGVLAGFLGIGGGLFRMPALVYLIGCPTHIAVGTDLDPEPAFCASSCAWRFAICAT